ncbi:MAG: S8 family serine peptidase [Deltaproteobacteria bacterium]|nr:S8 family serine peptidase [Deltaproteobacteria bacterium]
MVLKKIFRRFGLACLLLGVAVLPAQGEILSPRLQSLLERLPPQEEIPVLLYIPDLPATSLFSGAGKAHRRTHVKEALKSHAQQTQPPIQFILDRKGAKRIQSFWILNRIAALVKVEGVPELARIPGVVLITLDESVYPPPQRQAAESPEAWNLQAIRAPDLWALGYTGAGIVVATLDSGVDLNHPDLRPTWRGGENSWYDPHGEHLSPSDTDGHGTATMSLIVGGNAGGTPIGVAPNARWIAAKIFNDAGNAKISTLLSGFQWLLDPDGNPATDDAPHLVGNSWGFEASDQCLWEPPFDSIRQAISNLRASGIATVFSAGNYGPPAGGSISPANYPESFAVGAVDANLKISSFSSRGPGACDGSIYPELVGPGEAIKAANLTSGGETPNSYSYWSGTSFSVPQVVGAMALLSQAFPDLNLDELEFALKQSARDLGDFGPDQVYGYGLLDVKTAYDLLSRPAPKIAASAGTRDFGRIESQTSSADQLFFFLNKGLLDLQIRGVNLEGPNSEDYVIGENTCPEGILPPGEMCRIKISFSPLTPGWKVAALQISSNDPEVPNLEIWLSGSSILRRTKIGIFRAGSWYTDSNGNDALDPCEIDRCFPAFGGYPEDISIVGDWTGSGTTKIGIYRKGAWDLDRNGNGVWDGCTLDICYPSFGGISQDIPVVGDWAGTGAFGIGIYRQGQWYLDRNGNGAWDGCLWDSCIPSFGGPSHDLPVVGKW